MRYRHGDPSLDYDLRVYKLARGQDYRLRKSYLC